MADILKYQPYFSPSEILFPAKKPVVLNLSIFSFAILNNILVTY